jgi:surfeit locus 1 family protein
MLSARAQRAVVLVAALAGALLTARLGVWQLDRAAQKLALQQAMLGRAALPALSAGELAQDARQAEAQHWRRVRLQGRWRPEATLYLDNRQMHGRPGFFVLTPLLLPAGDAVLVQRGWIPRDAAQRTRLQPIDTPAGEVSLEGRVAPSPSHLYEFATAASEAGPIRQNVDLPALGREWRLALRPLSVQQLPDAVAPADGLQRDWPLPAVDVAKHHGYAFQWFAFSALITGLYVWFQLLRPRRRRAAAA